MKRLFLSLAVIACISLTASINAQEAKKDNKRGMPFSKELNLSDEQQKKMESVSDDFKAKMKDLREKSDLSKEDKQTKMKEIGEQHQTAINAILTPEQQTKMKELREKRADRPGMMRMRPNNGDRKDMGMRALQAPRGKGMQQAPRKDFMKDLNLTDDQKEKMKALNEDFSNKSKALNEQRRETLNKILTPEQQAKLKESRKDFPQNGRLGFRGDRNRGFQLDDESKAKIKSLTENYEKQKKAIELSRIAPDAQKEKQKALREQYRKDRRKIMDAAREAKSEKKS